MEKSEYMIAHKTFLPKEAYRHLEVGMDIENIFITIPYKIWLNEANFKTLDKDENYFKCICRSFPVLNMEKLNVGNLMA